MQHRPRLRFAVVLFAAGLLTAFSQGSGPFLAVADIRPGMVGIGRTVFEGEAIDEFKANILGVLHNIVGPGRDLILAKLEGGPLATTGVIAGMSGSPVYVDGKLIGAVSYSLGSFPKEPFAGITPIAEMLSAVDMSGPRINAGGLALQWPATPADVFSSLHLLNERAVGSARTLPRDADVFGPAALSDLAPLLRPIGAAMVMSGFDPDVDAQLRQALSMAPGPKGMQPSPAIAKAAASSLRPGDAVGITLIRGDLEMGATGTVTHIDGSHVYAFGHPFLNLGPIDFAMTHAHVYAVLPSLESSLKLATLGPVIGTVSQDRSTAIAGTLGPGPREVGVNVTLTSEHAPDQHFSFQVLRDQLLTPLFSYVAVINALASYERQSGVLSIATHGSISFGAAGAVAVDDEFAGDNVLPLAVAGAMAPVGVAATNDFHTMLPDAIDLRFTVAEHQDSATIERIWLDTTHPKFGATQTLQILLRNYRGGTDTIALPITMPAQASGPLTLLVSDAPTLISLERTEVRPGAPTNVPELLTLLNSTRRNNRLYVRLLSAAPGAVIGGQALPDLPSSVRSVLDIDKAAGAAPLSRAVVGAWEQPVNRVVKGSRELTVTLTSDK